MNLETQLAIVFLFVMLILLIILLFSKMSSIKLFTANYGWKILDENTGILEGSTNPLSFNPAHCYQRFDREATLLCSNSFDEFIKMSYGIQDKKETEQQLTPSLEDVDGYQITRTQPDVHVMTESVAHDEQLQSAAKLKRCISSDSLDSSASSIVEISRDVPTAKFTLKYDQATQMFSFQLHHLIDVNTDYGQIWLLFFLLPHPKPLWRTAARSTPSSFVDYNTVYQQCIRREDLHKIALLTQLYSYRDQSASIASQAKIRLKDLSLTNGNDAVVELSFLPNKSKYPIEGVGDQKLGEILFLMTFSQDRLVVIVSKIRNLSSFYKSAFIRLYIVQPMGKVTKKKTSLHTLVDGCADIRESMLFNICRSRMLKSHLRLSIVCESGEIRKSIGHVTLGPKSSGRELGHWRRAINNDSPSLATWHMIRPRVAV